MFEEMTYEKIMADMMDDMPNGIDTSEGSLIWNACAKQAVRLELAYAYLSTISKNSYVDTADLNHLILSGNEKGVILQLAEPASFKAQFNIDVEFGSRFNHDNYNYTVYEVIDEEKHIYEVECETMGLAPSYVLGELTPIDYIDGFEHGELLECIRAGRDQESTESFRRRILDYFGTKAYGGNRIFYMQQIKAIEGVGGVKIARRKEGDKFIHAVIISDGYRKPSDELVYKVQEAIDPEQNDGNGVGVAPIGHFVDIKGVEETNVDIDTTITYESGFTYENLKSYIDEAIEKYLLDVRMTWESSTALVVRIARLEAEILDVDGILDITGTTLNGISDNLMLENTIPVKGEVVCK